MTIVDEGVCITLGNNVNYYEKLGYEIPKYTDNQGRLKIKKGTKILVNIEHIPKGSDVLVKFICDYCNGENQIDEKDKFKKYDRLLKGRNLINKDCCVNTVCANKKSTESRKSKPVANGKSLAEKCPHLIGEWSERNTTTPFKHYSNTEEVAWWNCPYCESEYDMPIKARTSGSNCPYCTGMRVNRTNCLWTTHPEFAKLLKNPQRGYEISHGSNQKEDFICDKCGFEQIKATNDIVNQRFSCSRCSDGIRYPEKFTMAFLDQLGVIYQTQKIFDWSDNKRYDFYIPSKENLIIETHGIQHYEKSFETMGGRLLEEEQENDRLKETLAKENGIGYIVINCSKSELDFIKNNIIDSELSKLFDLSTVDWSSCHEFACCTLVKTVCELWEKGVRNTVEIGKIVKLERSTVCRYLKQGVELEWCDYDPKEEARKTIENNLIKARKTRIVKIIQLTEEGTFIREWDSVTEAQKSLNLNNIISVCRGKQNTAGGYKWMYKEKYEELINEKGEIVYKTKPRIVQLTLDGEYIAEHKNIGKATKVVGKNSRYHSHIKICCENNTRTAFGFKWMFKEDYDKLIETKEII